MDGKCTTRYFVCCSIRFSRFDLMQLNLFSQKKLGTDNDTLIYLKLIPRSNINIICWKLNFFFSINLKTNNGTRTQHMFYSQVEKNHEYFIWSYAKNIKIIGRHMITEKDSKYVKLNVSSHVNSINTECSRQKPQNVKN